MLNLLLVVSALVEHGQASNMAFLSVGSSNDGSPSVISTTAEPITSPVGPLALAHRPS
jgi:hypothetical protein